MTNFRDVQTKINDLLVEDDGKKAIKQRFKTEDNKRAKYKKELIRCYNQFKKWRVDEGIPYRLAVLVRDSVRFGWHGGAGKPLNARDVIASLAVVKQWLEMDPNHAGDVVCTYSNLGRHGDGLSKLLDAAQQAVPSQTQP